MAQAIKFRADNGRPTFRPDNAVAFRGPGGGITWVDFDARPAGNADFDARPVASADFDARPA